MAALFGLPHVPMIVPTRSLGTLWIVAIAVPASDGLVLAAFRLRSASLHPSVLAHGPYNSLAETIPRGTGPINRDVAPRLQLAAIAFNAVACLLVCLSPMGWWQQGSPGDPHGESGDHGNAA
jgi:hypothetical protein